jgi:undecaprenyl-diphosphatase
LCYNFHTDNSIQCQEGVGVVHIWEVVILGVIQGLTEFLPVSSSGHLVLAQNLFGLNSPGVLLEVVLHLGTLISVIIVYWHDLVGLCRGLWSLVSNPVPKRWLSQELRLYRRMVILLIVASIPTAAMGLLLEPVFDELFDSLLAVGGFLLVTGGVLWLIAHARPGSRRQLDMGPLDALFIGLAQGFAIAPGLSRSGMTISGALSRGLNRETATRFSFLLSLPAIGGAALLQLKDIIGETTQLGSPNTLLAGFLAAAAAGILAIKLVVGLLQRGKLQYFAYYVWIVGVFTIWRALRG